MKSLLLVGSFPSLLQYAEDVMSCNYIEMIIKEARVTAIPDVGTKHNMKLSVSAFVAICHL